MALLDRKKKKLVEEEEAKKKVDKNELDNTFKSNAQVSDRATSQNPMTFPEGKEEKE